MSERTGEQPEWRRRLREVGRAAFIREEMERLGFWSPEAEKGKSEGGPPPAVAEALAALKVRTAELRQLRDALAQLDGQIGTARDIPALLAEVRRKRIERVRAAREERRRQRLQETEARRERDRQWRRETLPFLGRGVSGGLKYEGGDSARLASLGLPVLATAAEVAAAIGISTTELSWLTYHRGAATMDHYHRFAIPKRSGGTRVISSPKRRLRVAQEWLLAAVLGRLPVHEAAMAFRAGRSIVDNARVHAGKAVVARLDLEEFFPSITFPRVKGLFESFGYNEGVATLLALLATEAPRAAVALATDDRGPWAVDRGPTTERPAPSAQRRFYVSVGARRLPQGACTSPAITNLLCRKLDTRLAGAAHRFGFAYTRYADDLVFSRADAAPPLGAFLELVRGILADEGFRVNEAKTRVMRPQHRQAVTGLVVNRAPAISRDDLRRFRAFLHGCETKGLPAMSDQLGRSAAAYASGYVAFIAMVSPERAAAIRAAHPWINRGAGSG